MAQKKDFDLPESQEREYMRMLLAFSRSLQTDCNQLLIPKIGELKRSFESEIQKDSFSDDLEQIITQLLFLANQSISTLITKLPTQYEAISSFNNRQFKLVVKANTGLELPAIMQGAPRAVSLGVDIFRSEPFLKPLMDNWVSENTSLIKSIPSKFHDDVGGIVRRGVANGSSVKTIQREIKDRYPVTDSRAKLIAQDQVLKANADLTKYRLQSIGVKEFIWNSVGDSRVRPAHVALDGKKFSWDKPHPTEGLPGTGSVRCRCRATAIFPDEEA